MLAQITIRSDEVPIPKPGSEGKWRLASMLSAVFRRLEIMLRGPALAHELVAST